MVIDERKTSPIGPRAHSDHWDSDERFFYRWYLLSQWALACITIVAVAVALCSLRSLNDSVEAANKQAIAAATQAQSALSAAQTAQKQLELSERPWLKVTATPTSDLTFDEGAKTGAHLTLQFQLLNRGKSPAAGVMIMGEFVCPPNSFDALRFQENECAGRRQAVTGQNTHYTRLGYPIFPGDPPFIENVTFQLNQSDIDATQKWFSHLGKVDVKFIEPQIVGCVVYNFGNLGYDTDFRYEIFRRSPQHPIMIVPQPVIALDELIFQLSEIGNEAH
jgi:type II secretory pathway pseudopilin PulG